MRRLQPARDGSGYLARDTVAALATAPGGAVTIVRISGPGAFPALAAIAPGLGETEPRKLHRARLIAPAFRGSGDSDPAEVSAFRQDDDFTLTEVSAFRQDGEMPIYIDSALCVRFVAPESFTGEDVVELHLHGGSFIAHRVLETLLALGVRQALPGEFSFRAVRNGKLALSQATAIADLIAATNDGAVSLALDKLSGAQNRLTSALAGDLRRLAALGEVGIDFADQDVDEVSLSRLKERLEPPIATLERLRKGYRRGLLLQDGIGVAFVGLPNAGKSSFFNALLGDDRSIVSDLPGTTRDVIRERLTLRTARSSITLRLEDTAGLRFTDDPIEKIGIDRTRQAVHKADLVLLLIDVSAPIGSALEQWRELGAPRDKAIGILTKCDLLDDGRRDRVRDECASFDVAPWVSTSALRGDGITEAVEAITGCCERWVARDPGEVLLTRLDQAQAVQTALEHLARARSAPEIELFASDIRQALHSLSPLIGETLPDDILGQIFSEFCIGK